MDIEEFEDINESVLTQHTQRTMEDLVLTFRKAEYDKAEKLVEELLKSISETDFFGLVLKYVNCLNFEWPQEIKRMAFEEYSIIELLSQKYGERTCDVLDFILFECKYEDADLRHLHSGAIHLMVILALRGVRKEITIEKIKNNSDSIHYIHSRTEEIFNSLKSI